MSANRITFALSLKREQDDINSKNLTLNTYVKIIQRFYYIVTYELQIWIEHYEKCYSYLTLCLVGFNRWLMSIYISSVEITKNAS